MTHWDSIKERILNELEKQKVYKQLSFNGKSGIYTIEFNDGKKFEFPLNKIKELPF